MIVNVNSLRNQTVKLALRRSLGILLLLTIWETLFSVSILLELSEGIISDPLGTLSDWSRDLQCANGWTGVCCDKFGHVTTMYEMNNIFLFKSILM